MFGLLLLLVLCLAGAVAVAVVALGGDGVIVGHKRCKWSACLVH